MDPSRSSLPGKGPHLIPMQPPLHHPFTDRGTESLEDKLEGLALNPKAKEFVPPKNMRGPQVSSLDLLSFPASFAGLEAVC